MEDALIARDKFIKTEVGNKQESDWDAIPLYQLTKNTRNHSKMKSFHSVFQEQNDWHTMHITVVEVVFVHPTHNA